VLTFSTRSGAGLSLMPRYVAVQITWDLRSVCGISLGFFPQGRLIYASPLLILPTGRSLARSRRWALLRENAASPRPSGSRDFCRVIISASPLPPRREIAHLSLLLSSFWFWWPGCQISEDRLCFSGLKVSVWEVWRISLVAQIVCLHWRLV